MSKKEQCANREFVRVLKWISQNNELWSIICGNCKEELTFDGFRAIMCKLQKESLYIPMYVFLTAYKDLSFVKTAAETMFTTMFIKEWRNVGTEVFREMYQALE